MGVCVCVCVCVGGGGVVDQLSYFSSQPVIHDWCNKSCGMCYPVCGMVHIKDGAVNRKE